MIKYIFLSRVYNMLINIDIPTSHNLSGDHVTPTFDQLVGMSELFPKI